MANVENSDPLIGTLFGAKYRIVEKLGSGGMGGVYLAEHLLMNRHVALKLLRSNLLEDEVLQKRFQNEAKAASQISHPNAVTLFDFGVEEGIPYLVMEYIQGKTLKRVLEIESPLSLERVQRILRQVAEALYAAHRLGIVHRDIKPDNFMIRTDEDGNEVAKVLDFGIAKSVGPSGMHSESNLTQVGMLVGTPQYMSPEQCQGRELDTRCDIYSLGSVVYEMLTGEPPFRAPSVLELLVRVLNSPAEPMRSLKPALNIPAEVDAAVLKSLEKDPAKRFSTVMEFSQAFDAAVARSQPKPKIPSNRKFVWVGAGAALVLAMGLVMSRGDVSRPSSTDPQLEQHAREMAEAAKRAEEEKQQALIRAARMKAEAEQARLAEEQRAKEQAEAARKAEAEKLAALKQAEEARAAAEQKSLQMKQMEEARTLEIQRRQEALKQAELERIATLKLQEEAAKKAEAEKLAAQRQAEEARAEAARLTEAAKKMEQEKAALMKMMEESEKKAALERAASEKESAEREAQQKLALEKAAREKAALEKTIAEKTGAEKAAAERALVEKVAAEKKAAERIAAERLARERIAQQTPTPSARNVEERRLDDTIRRANEQRLEAIRRAAALKVEAERQERAAREASERAARTQRENEERARAAARATPEPTQQPTPPPADSGEAQPKQRRRCGPTWCM